MDFADSQELIAYKKAVDAAWDDADQAERFWSADIKKSKKAITEIEPDYQKAMAQWQPLRDEYMRLLREYNELRAMMKPTRQENRLYKKSYPLRMELGRIEKLESSIDNKTEALGVVEKRLAMEEEWLRKNNGDHVSRAVKALIRSADKARYLGYLIEKIALKHGPRKAVARILKARQVKPTSTASSMSDKDVLKQAHGLYLSIDKGT